MRCRMSAKLVEVVRLNGSRAGCHDRFSSRRPVGGEVFYLDSPFIEPTIRPLIDHQRLKDWNTGLMAPNAQPGAPREPDFLFCWKQYASFVSLKRLPSYTAASPLSSGLGSFITHLQK